jgi:toxin YhaV
VRLERLGIRHGGTIPGGHRQWFRGKTGNGRYRIFYRYDSRARVIVYAWINDKAPRVFRGASKRRP